MKTYTEEDLRKAFIIGVTLYARSPLGLESFLKHNVDDYIESLTTKQDEDNVSFTYSFLRRKLDWSDFCGLTGVNIYAKSEGYEIEDNEIFYVTESKAKEFNLI